MRCYTPFRRCCLTLLFSLTLLMLAQAEAAALTMTDTATPTAIQAGQTEQLSATATPVNSHTNWSMTFTVSFNGAQLASQNFPGLTFQGGVPLTETWNWRVPTTATAGTYTFTAQLFDETGGFLISAQTTFSVTSASASGTTASASGTTIPSATQIVDSNGGVWTVDSNLLCYLNGTQAGNCNSVQTLLWYQGNMYVGSTVGTWWEWNGSGWYQVAGNPDPSSPPPPPPVNGACGSANGAVTNVAPSSNLCNAGTASAISGGTSGPWTWSCAGANGGSSATCSTAVSSCPRGAGYQRMAVLGRKAPAAI